VHGEGSSSSGTTTISTTRTSARTRITTSSSSSSSHVVIGIAHSNPRVRTSPSDRASTKCRQKKEAAISDVCIAGNKPWPDTIPNAMARFFRIERFGHGRSPAIWLRTYSSRLHCTPSLDRVMHVLSGSETAGDLRLLAYKWRLSIYHSYYWIHSAALAPQWIL
jgi:hypothetical protein